jgi:hypothetical protein
VLHGLAQAIASELVKEDALRSKPEEGRGAQGSSVQWGMHEGLAREQSPGSCNGI